MRIDKGGGVGSHDHSYASRHPNKGVRVDTA